jgi:transcriptional regulator with XRE-family HTH domain
MGRIQPLETRQRTEDPAPSLIDWNLFGQVVKGLRQEAGLKQEHIAASCKVDHSYISQIENGKRDNVSIKVIADLAQALGIKPTWLMFVASNIDREDEDVKTFQRKLRNRIKKKFSLNID